MTVKSAQQWSGLMVCKDSTGALSTPTAGPVGTLYVNGIVNGASVSISGSNPYKWTVTLPTLTAGDIVSMYIAATIATIATAAVVAEDTADTKRTSDLNDIAVGAAMTLADDSIKGATFDESSAYPIKSADAGATLLARVGAQMDLVNAPNSTALTAIAAAIWNRLTSALTTSGSIGKLIVDNLNASVSGLAAVIWAYATRTLTQTAEEAAAAMSGTNITFHRGDYNSFSITVGDISARTKLWLTVKSNKRDLDSAAILQLTEAGGLIRLNGDDAAAATDGSLTVTNATTGAITIVLKGAAAKDLAEASGIPYDVQVMETNGPRTVRQALCTITSDVTRAVS